MILTGEVSVAYFSYILMVLVIFNFLAFAQNLLQRQGPNPRNGTKSDQAHPPIHPTKYTNGLSVSHRFYKQFIKLFKLNLH